MVNSLKSTSCKVGRLRVIYSLGISIVTSSCNKVDQAADAQSGSFVELNS